MTGARRVDGNEVGMTGGRGTGGDGDADGDIGAAVVVVPTWGRQGASEDGGGEVKIEGMRQMMRRSVLHRVDTFRVGIKNGWEVGDPKRCVDRVGDLHEIERKEGVDV